MAQKADPMTPRDGTFGVRPCMIEHLTIEKSRHGETRNSRPMRTDKGRHDVKCKYKYDEARYTALIAVTDQSITGEKVKEEKL